MIGNGIRVMPAQPLVLEGVDVDREHAEYDDIYGEGVLAVYPNPETVDAGPDIDPDGSAWLEIRSTMGDPGIAIVLEYDQVAHLVAYLQSILESAH
jgi:hypothetical protein